MRKMSKFEKNVTFWQTAHILRAENTALEEITMDTKAMGERIQIAREERCMTQAGLAKAVGCTSQHISAIERGAKTPNRLRRHP